MLNLMETLRRSAERPFVVSSGGLYVTDPCDDARSIELGEIPAPSGTWLAHVGYAANARVIPELDRRVAECRAVLALLEGASVECEARLDDFSRARVHARINDVRGTLRAAQSLMTAGGQDELKATFLAQHQADLRSALAAQAQGGWLVTYLAVRRESEPWKANDEEFLNSFDELEGSVAVESGLAGFFDAESYRKASNTAAFRELMRSESEWPGAFAGTSFGVACSAGRGDGHYPCFARKDDDGCIVALIVTFPAECSL